MRQHIDRRTALKTGLAVTAGGILVACGTDGGTSGLKDEDDDFVTLYDMNAQALYLDGSYGPFTGIIRVDYIIANAPVTLDFWHGHGAVHKFTLTPDHYTQLKNLERVSIETTSVASHTHRLFIEPVDPRWRVQGAQPVRVPRS
jgi:hypothetical protein